MTSGRHWLWRAVPATPAERAAALWSFAYFFMLLAGYYVLRPVRDQMGIAGGVKALPWMFTATFVTLLVAQPLYGALVAKVPRRRFIPIVYHFFVANLALFWLLLTLRSSRLPLHACSSCGSASSTCSPSPCSGRSWPTFSRARKESDCSDSSAQAAPLARCSGPSITIALSVPLGRDNLLIVAAVLLEVAVYCVYRLERTAGPPRQDVRADQRIGGGAFAAFAEVLRSPYLLGIAAWVSLLSFGATILYFAQANLVSASVQGAGAQTRVFASVDLAVSVLTLLTQVVATGPLLKRFGTAVAAGALPAVYIVGFAVLALVPTLTVVLVFQVVQRWANFAIANPARQLFFTVVGREEKYKAKNLIDVVVYRGSDALYGWVYESMQALGLKLGAIAACALPVSLAWLALSAALGRTQERRAALAPGPGSGD